MNGQRAQLSTEYTRIRALRLRRFAKALPGHDVCDLSKAHLGVFIQSMADASPKARNHHRAGIKQFIGWCVRNDFLSKSNRLLESDSMRPEHTNGGTVSAYTAEEFRLLLEAADDEMRSLIAIAGLCGLRTAELLRLSWEDVWKVKGHIEISQSKSKTRSRRLVSICPALSAWLRTDRNHSGKLWTKSENLFHSRVAEICNTAGVKRLDNALRHSFCTYHFAAHSNENQTAQQAGNSPAMIHAHYKGLATKAEAKKWFNVMPPKSTENVIQLTAAKKSLTRRK
jgi:integrase